MSTRTQIDARMIIGYQEGEHRLLENGTVVIEDNEVVFVGQDYAGPVDEQIDAGDRIITPGFINTHAHLAGSPLDKSFIEDIGSRQFYLSGLPVMLKARAGAMGDREREACVDYSMAELIRTGTTTIMEMGPIGDYVADSAEKAGLRAYIADMYASARWTAPGGKVVGYAWNEAAGEQGFKQAVALIERLRGRANGRIQGYLSPAQIDNCTEALLRKSKEAADDLDVPLALHVSQAVFEFQEMVRRHGMTPIEWLDSIDFLSDRCILGHVMFPAGHSWVNFAGDDLAILADYDASVAHCTWVFNRRGLALESLPTYLERGINLCLGTDTSPQSMIEAMRWAAVVGKIMVRQTEKATAADVFNAATLNAARMLKRDDLGRICVGAKADLLFWDTNSMFMVPLRDPIKNIVYNATPEDLQDVMIDGKFVMRSGDLLTIDEGEVNAGLQAAGEHIWRGTSEEMARNVTELSPQTFKPFDVA